MRFGKINLGKFFDKEGYGYRSSEFSQPCNSNTSGMGEDRRKYNWNSSEMKSANNCGCKKPLNENTTPPCLNKHGADVTKQNSGNNTIGYPKCTSGAMRDRGNEPIVFDIRKEAFMTPDFRTALWTGGNLQLTVMTLSVGEETGAERHEGVDQLVGVISGAGEVAFGNRENYFADPLPLDAHSVILIPSGTYHNIKNVGKTPLKLYSVYAPKVHKFGTVDKTNA